MTSSSRHCALQTVGGHLKIVWNSVRSPSPALLLCGPKLCMASLHKKPLTTDSSFRRKWLHRKKKKSWWRQHLSRYWPFVRGIHRLPVDSSHKGQWRRALVFPLICAWTNGWANNRDADDLRRHRAHYDANVMKTTAFPLQRCAGYFFVINMNIMFRYGGFVCEITVEHYNNTVQLITILYKVCQ